MITCKKCGHTLNDTDAFCGICGTKAEVSEAPGKCCPNCGTPAGANDLFCNNCGYSLAGKPAEPKVAIPQPSHTKKKLMPAVITFVIALVIAGTAITLFAFNIDIFKKDDEHTEVIADIDEPLIDTDDEKNDTKDKDKDKKEEKDKEDKVEKEEDTKPKTDDFEDRLNTYISQNASHSDLGVAIKNNKTGKMYSSTGSNSSYVAWGWYLPVYLAYRDLEVHNAGVADGIMSSDAGVCNNSANTAIKAFGSPAAITRHLKEHYKASHTTYGRYFGETNAASDNYTTPYEAVSFLHALNQTNNYHLLSYNLSGFGINTPGGVTVYGQAGTENRNVRNALNLYAIVKGDNVDYSVAIMTKNYAGSNISSLLTFINTEMELKANE